MLANFIKLDTDIPLLMHFSDIYYVEREIWDKDLEAYKWVRTLVMWADELNGGPTNKPLSILSDKFKLQMDPYLKEKIFLNFDFRIKKSGRGFGTVYSVEAIPHVPPG